MATALQQVQQLQQQQLAVDVVQIQQDGQLLIQGFQGRVRQVEKDLIQQKVVNQEQAMGHEQEMTVEVHKREAVKRELNVANAQLAQQTARLALLEAKQEEDAQLILASRAEVQALQGQVANLAQQLQLSIQRANALEVQIRQMALRSEQQQQEILQQLKTQKSSDDNLGSRVVAAIGSLLRSSASLFNPSLYEYKKST